VSSLSLAARNALLSAPEVAQLPSLRRTAPLFTQGQAAESLYFIEDGLVKLSRIRSSGGHLILAIYGSGQFVGEEALSLEPRNYAAEAEVLSSATLWRIPRGALKTIAATNPELTGALMTYLLEGKASLAYKVELLCVHDVEYRILHYLAELSKLVKPLDDGEAYQLPLTQLELADLIGATRETTSSTLNQLERRGLLKLSRRLMTISSSLSLRSAARAKLVPAISVRDDLPMGATG
jgi:CRP-like cAMP-binding protein